MHKAKNQIHSEGICHSISEGTQQLLGKLKDENPISPQNSPWIGQNASKVAREKKEDKQALWSITEPHQVLVCPAIVVQTQCLTCSSHFSYD